MVQALPELTEETTAEVLRLLGVSACTEHAPDDSGERIAGHLAGAFAVIQQHVAARQEHQAAIGVAYHAVRARYTEEPCKCGSRYDGEFAVVYDGDPVG